MPTGSTAAPPAGTPSTRILFRAFMHETPPRMPDLQHGHRFRLFINRVEHPPAHARFPRAKAHLADPIPREPFAIFWRQSVAGRLRCQSRERCVELFKPAFRQHLTTTTFVRLIPVHLSGDGGISQSRLLYVIAHLAGVELKSFRRKSANASSTGLPRSPRS